jgi:site-specific recombinase XerD
MIKNYEAALQSFEMFLITQKRSPENTVKSYLSDVRQLIDFLKEEECADLSVCTHELLVKFLHSLHIQKISARTVNRKIASIRNFFENACQGLRNENPARNLVMPRPDKVLPRYLSEEDISKLLTFACGDHSAKGLRNCLIVYLLYAGGLRISEALSLTVGSFRFDEGFVMVTGKRGKERTVPLPKQVLSLARHIAAHTLTRLGVTQVTPKTPLFFTARNGILKVLSRQQCWRILKELCVQSGISTIVSPHALRHSLATHLLAQGADLRQLQLLMGHEKIDTIEVYTHVETSRLRNLYDKSHPRS